MPKEEGFDPHLTHRLCQHGQKTERRLRSETKAEPNPDRNGLKWYEVLAPADCSACPQGEDGDRSVLITYGAL